MRFDVNCNICGSSNFREVAVRADSIPVVLCSTCGHGVVRYFTDDVESLYQDDYFSSAGPSAAGYEDYAYMAEHGVSWAAALVDLLRPGGRVLDIGCADGHLLKKLGPSYERYGIEPNLRAREQCRSAGISILAADIMDDRIRPEYAHAFDVELAIAVFEHVPDFRGAVEAALDLLKPDGLLLFEVPLFSEVSPSDDPWLRTSLEHIHYPTSESLDYLFRNVLGLEFAGYPVLIRTFAHTYIGMASRSKTVLESSKQRLDRCLTASPATLNPLEARFRFLFEVVHAANNDPEVLALCRHLLPRDVNYFVLRRLADLWAADVARLEDAEMRWRDARDYLKEVEAARDWHANESDKRNEVISAQARTVEEQARAYEKLQQRNQLLTQANEEVRRQVELYIQQLRNRDEELQELGNRLRAGQETQAELQRVVEDSQVWRSQIEASLSWRFTKPLRVLGSLAKPRSVRKK